MENNGHSQKSIADRILEKLIKLYRLDPERWEFVDIVFDSDEFLLFSDEDPDRPIVDTDTEGICDADLGSVTVFISMKHNLRHTCSCCGKAMNIHKWLDTTLDCPPILGMKSRARISVPQLFCRSCEIYRKARCPLAIPNCTYTKLTKIQVASVAMRETLKSTAKTCGVGEWIVSDIIHTIVDEGKAKRDLSGTKILFIDEIQSAKGQNYVTMTADQDHVTIAGELGHDMDSIKATRDELVLHGGDPSQIEFVSIDMSAAYKAGIKKYFPNATIIPDKFHVLKMPSDAVNEVRKRTNRELKKEGKEYPKGVRFTVLYNKENQDEKHKARMEVIRVLNPTLALAFDIKEEFREFYEAPDKEAARERFQKWYDRANLSKIPEMQDVASRLADRLEDLLNWFDHRISNGVAEGMNSVYKRIKAAAYGFRKPQYLIDFCMFRKGRLKVSI